jgi:hypothetical protein
MVYKCVFSQKKNRSRPGVTVMAAIFFSGEFNLSWADKIVIMTIAGVMICLILTSLIRYRHLPHEEVTVFQYNHFFFFLLTTFFR